MFPGDRLVRLSHANVEKILGTLLRFPTKHEREVLYVPRLGLALQFGERFYGSFFHEFHKEESGSKGFVQIERRLFWEFQKRGAFGCFIHLLNDVVEDRFVGG